jgi:hypothetical protein
MARWIIALVAGVAVVYVSTVLIAGEPEFLIPGAILFALVVGYAVFQRALTRAHLRRHHGDPAEAMRDDDDWAIPSAHLIADDDRPTGDTPEVHDEINPHDLSIDHPGARPPRSRPARRARRRATSRGAPAGASSPRPHDTDERTGERQHSAAYAKTAGGGGGDGGPPGTSAGDAVEDRPLG